MTLRTVFFGSSDSVFSNRHFAALLETACDIGRGGRCAACAAHQRPTRERGRQRRTSSSCARQHGIPAFEPASPNARSSSRRCADLRPDLFLAVGYTQPAESRDPRGPAPAGGQLPRVPAAGLPGQAPALLGAAKRRALGRADRARDGARPGHGGHPLPGARPHPPATTRWRASTTGSSAAACRWSAG